jgi:Domain of unknown function (DUF4248)
MKPWPVQGFLLDILRHFKNMDEQFKIKSYAYCELALLYFPNSNKNSASTQLGRWIRQNENLRNQLYELDYKPRKKILTPSQVRLIVNFFGEP